MTVCGSELGKPRPDFGVRNCIFAFSLEPAARKRIPERLASAHLAAVLSHLQAHDGCKMAKPKSNFCKAVLIVEDEPLIRMLAVDVVEEAGFHVIEAANTDEAVRILECTSNIALVFTDVDTPGAIDGMRFAAVVHDRWAPVQIIVTSGLTNINMATLPTGAVFFSKPCNTQKLVKQMHLTAA